MATWRWTDWPGWTLTSEANASSAPYAACCPFQALVPGRAFSVWIGFRCGAALSARSPRRAQRPPWRRRGRARRRRGPGRECARSGSLRCPRPPALRFGGRRLDYTRRVPLTGKRILITGGAGFIGTTLARRLVDANEVIAFDNLHRDALTGSELAGHAGFTFVQGDVLDPGRPRRGGAGCHAHRPCGGDRGRRHGAREPGAHDAGQPDRHLQRARGGGRDAGHAGAADRVLDQRGVRPARVQRRRGPRDRDRIGRGGALDLRRLEARRRAHGARVPRRARVADRLGAARSTSTGRGRSAAARSARSSRRRSTAAT